MSSHVSVHGTVGWWRHPARVWYKVEWRQTRAGCRTLREISSYILSPYWQHKYAAHEPHRGSQWSLDHAHTIYNMSYHLTRSVKVVISDTSHPLYAYLAKGLDQQQTAFSAASAHNWKWSGAISHTAPVHLSCPGINHTTTTQNRTMRI